MEQLGKFLNYYFLWSDDTLLFCHYTNKLNLKCYVLYETKKLLTITKMYFTIISTLIFIISIAVIIIIITIIIIVITITVIAVSIIIVFVKSPWRICWIRIPSISCVKLLLTHAFYMPWVLEKTGSFILIEWEVKKNWEYSKC